MDKNHLYDRITRETSISKLLDENDYDIRQKPKKAPQDGDKRVTVINDEESLEKVYDMYENQEEDLSLVEIELIVKDDEKGEWKVNKIAEDLGIAPYVYRQRNMEKQDSDGDKAVYVGEFTVANHWFKE